MGSELVSLPGTTAGTWRPSVIALESRIFDSGQASVGSESGRLFYLQALGIILVQNGFGVWASSAGALAGFSFFFLRLTLCLPLVRKGR